MTVSVPVRIEAGIAESVRELAERHKVSANRIWTEAIEAYLKAEKANEWRMGFEAMANDRESGDVEYMTPAAVEAFDSAGI